MRTTVVLGVAGALFVSLALLGQEHPGTKVRGELKVQDVEMAIMDHIEQDEMLQNRFMVYDEKKEIARVLTFERFHTVNQLDDGSFFVCVDFEGQNKDMLDLDFYIDETAEGLKLSKLVIHKVNGKSRL
ncbi:MAG: hypothetical protein IID13_00505 [Candidatus Marinimicrobia bacterium]|nr:hypothetical protein [Candidatus Neomarinimicrobiota bacterium]